MLAYIKPLNLGVCLYLYITLTSPKTPELFSQLSPACKRLTKLYFGFLLFPMALEASYLYLSFESEIDFIKTLEIYEHILIKSEIIYLLFTVSTLLCLILTNKSHI